MFSVYRVDARGVLGDDLGRRAIKEAQAFFDGLGDQGDGRYGSGVVTRGIYDVAGMRADADFMIWTHAERVRGSAGRVLRLPPQHRVGQGEHARYGAPSPCTGPAEYNKSHVPAFLAGEEPRRYICVYPFVRSYDWYLLPDAERRDMLASTARRRAGTRTCAPTRSRRSPSATTSGSSRSRPTSCTGS